MTDDTPAPVPALIAEAKRQAPAPLRATLGERIGGLVRYQPLRALWRARVAWLLYSRWNRPLGDPYRMSLLEEWRYAFGLAEMLDDFGYLSPAEAIDEDRYNWED